MLRLDDYIVIICMCTSVVCRSLLPTDGPAHVHVFEHIFFIVLFATTLLGPIALKTHMCIIHDCGFLFPQSNNRTYIFTARDMHPSARTQTGEQ
jgi:hypothetical protein